MSQDALRGCLSGERVVLEPLQEEHIPALSIAVSDGELWNLWYTSAPHPDEMKTYVEQALASEQRGEALAFAVRDRHSGQIVGCTRLMSWDQTHRRIEIGHTWYAKSAQRTGVNSECKLLLLTYAFETLDVIAVEFRTHWHNQRSREAITRLGAKQDGVLRNHRILKDGTIRDTVVYSIIASEWPSVKQNLKFRMRQYLENQ
ncbi:MULTISPECIES: GNAT family N-acetyltransferase [Shewanella]|uniref:GNAT family N-acetyltransferase n=1 Tax=Shewanella TaxID=22 RepID=UPI001182B58E|nr:MULTISPECIES: GNAT family protein [Shewanella]QYJ95477.1 GNAT family N-acetyltransferase [Shewanella spartinae]QYJ99283.1 GNAT family N-acetyltransferase [Shewanella alkalitolerans]QYK14591.1 GNAT family N-acetyltransferase [Shewanella rhizosphaerae]TVP16115.1 GCN5 family acetyltransferase [Shewanella sp. KCT]